MQFIRVDMSAKTVTVEDVPPDYVGLGGRGLTSIVTSLVLLRIVSVRGANTSKGSAEALNPIEKDAGSMVTLPALVGNRTLFLISTT